MTTATAEKSIRTGNVILDMKLPLLTGNELDELARYANYLIWSRDDENDDWADAPLTAEEEEALRQGREDFKNGDYLTLDEFLKGLEED